MPRRPGKPRSANKKRKTKQDKQRIDADDETNDRPGGSTTFYDLPAELRNDIYGMAVQDQVIVFPNDKGRAEVPGILMASRQIHQEALPMLYVPVLAAIVNTLLTPLRDSSYSEAIFQFCSSERAISWLRKIGSSKRKLLQMVDIDISNELKHVHCADGSPMDQFLAWGVKFNLEFRHLVLERRLSDHDLRLKPQCLLLTSFCLQPEPCYHTSCYREDGTWKTGSRYSLVKFLGEDSESEED